MSENQASCITDSNGAAKKALADWAEKNGITPAEFHRGTGFTYHHSWCLLRGNAAVTERTLGRLLMFYPDAARQVAAAMVIIPAGSAT